MKSKTIASVVFGLVTAIGVAVIAIYMGSMKWLKIKEEYIYSSKVKKSLKILHISDLHSTHRDKMNLDIWGKIEGLEFDMVVITGDVIMDHVEQIYPHLPKLKLLAEKTPVYYVDGNHEVFFHKEIKDLFEENGIRVLYNKKETITIGGNKINIIGLRDFYYLKSSGFSGVDELFVESEKDAYTIVLSHQPQIFDRIKSFDFNLVLSGHTHGGQLRLPFVPTIFAPYQGFFPKYGDGWFEEKGKKLYVSRGIGTTIVKVRFYNRPEIAVINVLPMKEII